MPISQPPPPIASVQPETKNTVGSPLPRSALLWAAGILLISVVGGTVWLKATPAAQPKLKWTAASLALTLSPGDTATRIVTLTSDTTIGNIQLEAVPAIAPFLTIQPTSFSTFPANQSQTVRLLFTIPQGTTLGTYDGTIHVRNGSQTLPQTLKVGLTLWNAFYSPELGISIKYPPDFVKAPTSATDVVGFTANTPDQDASGIWIHAIPNDAGASLIDWWNSRHFAAPASNPSARIVAGRAAIEVTVDPDGLPETHVIVANGSTIYDILLASLNGTIAESILATLAF